MAEQFINGSIAAPGFYGLNLQDSSVQLSSGFALEAYNCVIDKYGRIGARKGWTKVNTAATSPAGAVRTIFEFVKADGTVVFSAANNKLYTGTTTLTENKVFDTHFHTGTYSQSGTTVTITITSHGYTVGTQLYLTVSTGTFPSGYYTVATVGGGNSFTVTAAASATTSGNIGGCVDVLTTYTITDDNWQVAAMPLGTGLTASAHSVWMQEGHIPLVYHKIGTSSHAHTNGYGFQRLGDVSTLPSGYSTATFKPSCGIYAFGRLWVAGTDSSDTQTIYFSDLQDPSQWQTGTSGKLDISAVIPTGDPIIALAQHNNFLVIFCKRHIVVYSGAKDPSTMALADTITGVGCIARDSVVSVAGTDILFLSETGIQSLQRVIQEKSLPFRDVSKNVRDDLLSNVNSEVLKYIKAVYYPTDAFYLLSLPSSNIVYCFDTRGALESGASRATIWRDIKPTAFCLTESRALYLGQKGYIGEYTGQSDNGTSYRMSYYTNYFDMDNPTAIKILKKVNIITIGGSSQALIVKWGYDYTSSYNSETVLLDEQAVAEYGIAEYNIGTFNTGIVLDSAQVQTTGSGTVVQLGFESDINGAPLSVQKIDFSIKMGKNI